MLKLNLAPKDYKRKHANLREILGILVLKLYVYIIYVYVILGF